MNRNADKPDIIYICWIDYLRTWGPPACILAVLFAALWLLEVCRRG
jgi:hypothetical protein